MKQELIHQQNQALLPSNPGSGVKHPQEETFFTEKDQKIEFGLKPGFGRYVGSLGCCFLIYLLWTQWPGDAEEAVGFVIVALLACFFAIFLPCYRYGFIDLSSREVVDQKRFGPFRLSNRIRSLTDFECVTVRHIGDTEIVAYAASIGLKTKDGTSVLWIKEFSANEEEVPAEAVLFAKELGHKVGLPVSLCGWTIQP